MTEYLTAGNPSSPGALTFVLEELPYGRIDELRPLWEQLRRHHAERNGFFARQILSLEWEERKSRFFQKGKTANFQTACEKKSGSLVGYCIATITPERDGEVDSLVVDIRYRKAGIGSRLLERSLEWLASMNPADIDISVMAGNEEVLPLYAKYGFLPRSYTLKRKKD